VYNTQDSREVCLEAAIL